MAIKFFWEGVNMIFGFTEECGDRYISDEMILSYVQALSNGGFENLPKEAQRRIFFDAQGLYAAASPEQQQMLIDGLPEALCKKLGIKKYKKHFTQDFIEAELTAKAAQIEVLEDVVREQFFQLEEAASDCKRLKKKNRKLQKNVTQCMKEFNRRGDDIRANVEIIEAKDQVITTLNEKLFDQGSLIATLQGSINDSLAKISQMPSDLKQSKIKEMIFKIETVLRESSQLTVEDFRPQELSQEKSGGHDC